MKLNAAGSYLILTMAFWGCSDSPDSDVIGPRATKFKSGVTFALYATAETSDASTIDRSDPVSGDMLHLIEPPLLSKRDIKDVSIMEAPGQWPIVTVTFDAATAKRFSQPTQHGGDRIAVVVNEAILFTLTTNGKPLSKLEISSSIERPDIRAFVN